MVRWEKEGEFATRSLEFEYLQRKSRCKVLIGGDDISNDVYTLDVFFNVCLHLCSFPLCTDGRKSDSSINGGIRGGIQIPETYLQALLPLPAPPPQCPGELARWLLSIQINNLLHYTFTTLHITHKDNLQIKPLYAVGDALICP